MSNQDADDRFWWEREPKGKPFSLGLVHLDRKGSTLEWKELPESHVRRRAESYYAGVEYVARTFDAAQPLNWQGDGVLLLIPEGGEAAPLRAFRAAQQIWQRIRVDLNLPVRLAAHWGRVAWDPDPGQIRDPALDLCGHLGAVAPVDAIAVSEDVFLALPEAERRELAPLGFTARDHLSAYVWPAVCAERKDPVSFRDEAEQRLWDAFRAYAHAPEVNKLRYVGFRLVKKEPPALDIRDVFVPLDVELRRRAFGPRLDESARRRLAGEAPGSELPFARLEDMHDATETRPFGQIFAQHRNLVVLGEPGSGKTTLLRWLAVAAAGGRYGLSHDLGTAERLLALPVSVGRLAEIRRGLGEIPSVVDAMAAYFHERSVGARDELAAFLDARLAAGDCLVLLDGLDEVGAAEREVVRAWLEAFAAAKPRNRFVASSRRVGYAGFALPGAEEVTLCPFNDKQVERYVRAFTRAYRRWETGTDDPHGAKQAADELLKAVRESTRLGALARNPFLLAGIALIHRAEGALPRHRVQLYEIFARCLCEAWSAARRLVAKAASPDIRFEEEAVPILGDLALHMHTDHPAGRAPRDYVLEKLRLALSKTKDVQEREAEAAAKEFLHRAGEQVQLFLERGPGEWGFLHLTFQEFFAAAGLHAQERFEAVALEHWWEPRWEEVLRLGVGYMAIVQKRPAAARNFIQRIREAPPPTGRPWITESLQLQVPIATLLAAEAGDALPPADQQAIAADFVRWNLHFPGRTAGRVLGEVSLTDFREPLADRLIPFLRDSSWFMRQLTAQAIGDLGSTTALTALVDTLAGLY